MTTVTPLSKTLALIIFIVSPIIGFYLGTTYPQELPTEATCVVLTDSILQQGIITTYSKVVEHTEPIALSGNDILLIEDTEYRLSNSITAEDDSKIIIRNSKFIQTQDHSSQYNIQLTGNASMEIEDSIINTDPWLNWDFFDNSSLSLTNIKYENLNLWIGTSGYSTITIKDSTFRGTISDHVKLDIDGSERDTFVEFVFPLGAVVDEEFPTVIDDFHFPNENDKFIDYQVDIINSRAEHWAITASPNSDITLRNTKSINMTFYIGSVPGLEIDFTDLKAKHYEDSSWELGTGTVRLINSGVFFWSPSAGQDNIVTLRDSDLADFQFSSQNAQINIYDSSIALLIALENVSMRIENSYVESDVIAKDNGYIELINTEVGGQIIEEDNGRVVVR